MIEQQAEALLSLFASNPRSYGQWNPDTTKSSTVKEKAADAKIMARHLAGKMGLGLVPILDDARTMWGALDIDNHKDKSKDIDISAIERVVVEHGLPMVPCRSKSGGVHLFIFFSEPVRATIARRYLKSVAPLFEVEVDCIFPKQDALPEDSTVPSGLAYGNWINLPYFGGDETNRYAWISGKRAEIELFLTHAQALKITQTDLEDRMAGDLREAPPCVQSFAQEPIGEGESRNNALTQVIIWLKRQSPDKVEEMAYDYNAKYFDPPLPHSEAKKTIKFGLSKTYRYMCSQEPMKSRCNRELCKKRKYGIRQADELAARIDPNNIEITDIVRESTEPSRWLVTYRGQRIALDVDAVIDLSRFQKALANKGIAFPTIPKLEWEMIRMKIIETTTVIAPPPDADVAGMTYVRLQDFIKSKADYYVRKGHEINDVDRGGLLLGKPVVFESDGIRYAYVISSAFRDHLKRNRSEDLKGTALWHAMKDRGVEDTRIKVGGSVHRVWVVQIAEPERETEEPNAPDFKPAY